MRKTIAGVALAAIAATTTACGGSTYCLTIRPQGDLPDLVMLAGNTVETSLLDHFVPRECMEMFLADFGDEIFEARSDDPEAVAVSVSGGVLTTAAIAAADSVRVTVDVLGHFFGEYRPADGYGCIRQPGSRCPSLEDHEFHVSVAEQPPR